MDYPFKILIVLFLTLCVTSSTYAEDARVLPKGRSRMALTTAQTGAITQTFNADGKPESITAPYNLELNSEKLRALPGLGTLIDTLNNLHYRYDVTKRNNAEHGVGVGEDATGIPIGEAVSRGLLNVEGRANRRQFNAQYQYGVTDRLSVGFMVPYIRTSVSIDHSFGGVNSAVDIRDFLNATSGNVNSDILKYLNQIASANSDTLQGLLTQRGYARVENWDGSGLGDIVAGGRFNYLNHQTSTGEWLSSFQAGVTLPTGKIRPPREITQQDFGQGAWDIGLANILNYSPTSLLTLSNGIHYTYRLPSHRIMRPRENPTDVIPDASSEEDVAVKLGDKFWATLGAKLSFTRAISIEGSYDWTWKKENRYSGSRPKDYSYLSEQTDSYLETIQIGASFSTIPAFMKFEFPVPAEVSVNVFVPTRGKNAIIAPYGTAELALFF